MTKNELIQELNKIEGNKDILIGKIDAETGQIKVLEVYDPFELGNFSLLDSNVSGDMATYILVK